MATDKPRLSISMDEETFEKVIAYKKEKGIATQSKAIIKIMEMGLNELEKEVAQNKSSSTGEPILEDDEMLGLFNALNDMLVSAGVIKEDEDITERQADVLIAICRIIDATFKD